ncbi:393_t:CDS:1, partial [Dentiscutata erythropus]
MPENNLAEVVACKTKKDRKRIRALGFSSSHKKSKSAVTAQIPTSISNSSQISHSLAAPKDNSSYPDVSQTNLKE